VGGKGAKSGVLKQEGVRGKCPLWPDQQKKGGARRHRGTLFQVERGVKRTRRIKHDALAWTRKQNVSIGPALDALSKGPELQRARGTGASAKKKQSNAHQMGADTGKKRKKGICFFLKDERREPNTAGAPKKEGTTRRKGKDKTREANVCGRTLWRGGENATETGGCKRARKYPTGGRRKK